MTDMKKLSWAAIVLGFALLIISALPAIGPQYTLFEGSTFHLPQGTTAIDLKNPPADFRQDLLITKDQNGPLVDLSALPVGQYTIVLEPSHQKIEVQLLSHKSGYIAALGALLLLLGLPGVLIPNSALVMEGGGTVNGWLYLLVDQHGLNLPRVLLIIFFVPCTIVFLTLAFPLHQFPNLPDSIWQLLGFGGAGAALGAILEPGAKSPDPGTPPDTQLAYDQVAAAAIPASALPSPVPGMATIKRPHMTDLFRDPNGYGDISHFQTLVISLSTVVVFLFSFFDDWEIPAIPDRVLELLATSLAVYLGVKGIKIVKQS